MNADYFGKGCKFLTGRWENSASYRELNINYKNRYAPNYKVCTNIKNMMNAKNNCCGKLCPLKKHMRDFMEDKNEGK